MSTITSDVIESIISQVIAEKNIAARPFSYDAANELLSFGASRVGAEGPTCPPKYELARWIDHTLLKADATQADIEKICNEANEHQFASVCINPTWVPLASKILRGGPSKVCTVTGFPLGATFPEVKARETERTIEEGAAEVDMVINIGALKSGDYNLVERDIRAVVRAAGRRVVKVILETCLLTDEEKVKACAIAQHAGANFVKTSTGFSKGGATVEDVELMRRVVGAKMGVKAAGGIRTLADAQAMIAAGASRLGASSGGAIVQEALK